MQGLPRPRHLQCYKYLYTSCLVTRRTASVCTNGVIMGLDGGGGTYLSVLITKQSWPLDWAAVTLAHADTSRNV